MLIFSWNVAGLGTTVQRIQEEFGSGSSNKQQHVLQDFFERHHADIVCLQEHKIPYDLLKQRKEPLKVAQLPAFESFWSCSISQKGRNGVVTYAKRGTVVAADAAPLRDKELDEQGRCVMTDHGTFVLFNVYVPASTPSNPLSEKMRFLRALERAMSRQTKPVMLVGDLNITRGPLDVDWRARVVAVDEILRSETLDQHSSWKQELVTHWDNIQTVLRTKKVVDTQTTNSKSGKTQEKKRLAVTLDGKTLFLGRHETDEFYCMQEYDFDEKTYFDEEFQETVVCHEANLVPVAKLSELMHKIAKVTWDEDTQRVIADKYGKLSSAPHRKWLEELLQKGRVDVFRHLYPTAQARFTCWNQFTNKRYTNEGYRIDYTIIDECLMDMVADDPKILRCGTKVYQKDEETWTEEAALEAATCNGRFQPAAFEGGGLAPATPQALATQFLGSPHTGMVYTPPTFSDHIAVSLHLRAALFPSPEAHLQTDAITRKAQPHKSQASITTFFNKCNGTTNIASSKRPLNSTTTRSPRKKEKSCDKKAPINSILYHFQKQI